jgi:SM-20-related protein
METLRENFNRTQYLGLTELESHFTIYPPGAFYRRHLDRFRGSEQRQISSILYLNQGWSHEHGGQLRLYLDETDDAAYLDIEPAGGTLVLFLSDRFWHEVLPATRQRMSLTGWFRTRP